MTIFLWIWIPLCVIALMGCFYMLYRNSAVVYKVRMKALENDDSLESLMAANKRYDALPSYNEMMWMLFTFKYEDFVSKKRD